MFPSVKKSKRAILIKVFMAVKKSTCPSFVIFFSYFIVHLQQLKGIQGS